MVATDRAHTLISRYNDHPLLGEPGMAMYQMGLLEIDGHGCARYRVSVEKDAR